MRWHISHTREDGIGLQKGAREGPIDENSGTLFVLASDGVACFVSFDSVVPQAREPTHDLEPPGDTIVPHSSLLNLVRLSRPQTISSHVPERRFRSGAFDPPRGLGLSARGVTVEIRDWVALING